jgi:hypothetical protein
LKRLCFEVFPKRSHGEEANKPHSEEHFTKPQDWLILTSLLAKWKKRKTPGKMSYCFLAVLELLAEAAGSGSV